MTNERISLTLTPFEEGGDRSFPISPGGKARDSTPYFRSPLLEQIPIVMLQLSLSLRSKPLYPQTFTPHLLHPQCISHPPLFASIKDTTILQHQTHPMPPGLHLDSMPNHVAVVMDGNRRWARMRGLPVGSGYQAGYRALRGLVELCCNWGIRVLTVFAFSSDNWIRPKVEVDFLLCMFERVITDELNHFVRENIRISMIGDPSKLPDSLQELITNVEETTKNNSRLHLVVAISYSGHYDIVQACKTIAVKVKDGLIEPQDVNEVLIEQELQTNCSKFPYPDLLIRTSGELRVSNFLLWQLAYTELFFAQSHWPDFGEDEFIEALHSFQRRRRSYGG